MPDDATPRERTPSRQLWRYARTAMRLLIRRPVLGVGIIPLFADGRIVLVRRVDSGLWSVPGGIVDWGETIEQTARREIAEEAGLEIVRIARLVGVYSALGRDPRAHAVSVVIAADVRGEPRVHDPLELSEARAFAPGELPFGQLAHDHERQIRDYLSGATVVR